MGVFDPVTDLPTITQTIGNGDPSLAPQPGEASGTGGLVSSALGSGLYGGLASLGSGAEAAARAAGFSSAADAAAAFAQRQRDTAATYARPDLEGASILSPSGFAYKMLQGVPSFATVAGGAALATIGAPEEAAAGVLGAGARAMLGGSAAAFPGAVGENIQRARDEGQPVDQGTALKALALGVPEAALQAALPVMGEGMLAGRVAGSAIPKIFAPGSRVAGALGKSGAATLGKVVTGAGIGAAVQVPAAAAGEALMQQMGDPNRSFAQRSQDIVSAALSGGVQGAFVGGALHAIAKTPPAEVTAADMLRVIDTKTAPVDNTQPGAPNSANIPQGPPPGGPGPVARPNPIQDSEFGRANVPPYPGFKGDVVRPDMDQSQPGQPNVANIPAAIPVGTPDSGARAGIPIAPGDRGEITRPIPVGVPDGGALANVPPAPDPGGEVTRPIPVVTPGGGARAGVPPASGERGEVTPTPSNLIQELPLPGGARANIPETLANRGNVVQPPSPQLQIPYDPLAARDERVSRPASSDEPVITPPPIGGDLTQSTGADLLATLMQHGPKSEVGQRIVSEIDARTQGVPIKSADDLRAVLAQQDQDRVKAQVAQQQLAAVKQATGLGEKGLKAFLPAAHAALGDDVGLKAAVYDQVQSKLAAQKAPVTALDIPQILGKRLTNLARSDAVGVLDDKGNLVDPRATQEQNDTAQAQTAADQDATTSLGPNPHVPSRDLRDAIPEGHQAKWDALEALRKDAPQNFLPMIDEQQSRLATPKGGEAGRVVSATARLRKAIEGQKAVDAATLAKPEPATPLAPVDETQGARKFSPSVSEAKAAADALTTRLGTAKAAGGARSFNDEIQRIGAEALSKQDQLKSKQRGAKNGVQERSPAPVGAQEQPEVGGRNGGRDAQGQAPAGKVEASARAEVAQTAPKEQITPEHVSAITKALKAAKDNIDALKAQTLAQGKRGEKGQEKLTAQYQSVLDTVEKQRAQIEAALKSGDPAQLAKVGNDHFSSKAYDDFYEHLSVKGQKLFDAHAQILDKLLDAVKEASGQNHTLIGDQAFSSREPTPHDQVLSDMLDRGATTREMLEHTVRNGSNSIRRSMAARILQKSKSNPSIRFGTLDEMAKDHPTRRNVYGDYNDALNRIRIFDKADLEHTLLHEATHAGTVRGLANDPALAKEAATLHAAAKAQMTPEEAAHPSMANPEEMVAEAGSNADFANLLDTMKGPGGSSIWQSVKDLVRRIFGFPKGAESMLDHVENLADRAADVTNNAATPRGMERVTGLYARTVQDAMREGVEKASRVADLKGFTPTAYKMSLFWRNLDDIARGIGHRLPSLLQAVQDKRDYHNYVESMHAAVGVADNARRALDKKGQENLSDLKMASPKRIDPQLAPAQHTWLSPERLKELTPEILRYNRLWAQMNGGDRAVAKAYTQTLHASEAQMYAAQVARGRQVVERSGLKINLASDPMERFNGDISGMKTDPTRSRGFWKNEAETLAHAVRAYTDHAIEAIKAEPDPEKAAAIKRHIEDARSWQAGMTRTEKALTQEPNFPVRRFGDQHVSWELADNFGPAEAAKLRAMLDAKGFTGIAIDHNIDNNTAYARVKGLTAGDALKDVIKAAIQKGLVKQIKSSGDVKNLYNVAGMMPSDVTSQIQAFRDNFPPMDTSGPDAARAVAYNEAVERQLDQMQQSLMDILSDTNMSKLLAYRENVQGMSTDMARASLERGSNMAHAVSQMFMASRMDATRKALKAEVEAAKRNPDMDLGTQHKIQAAANETLLRDAQRQWRVEPNIFDRVRRATHILDLGLSVPYALTLGTQTWTLGLSELTKHFGAVRSARAIASAHPMAFRIMKAAFSGNDKLAFTLTRDKLDAAGVPKAVADYILHLNNMGAFDTSYTQWVRDGIHHHDGPIRQLHDISGAFTTYSEMLPRLVQAVASRELYNERAAQGKAPRSPEFNDVHSFALNQVNNSQFSWLADLNPRAFGKHGVAGAASPLVAQFQGFRVKMLEKLHREVADAFGARGPEYATQARRFLLMHLAAQTALAGTMGLPAASMVAGVYDRLADWATGDHTHDLRASYRGWLSTVFGNGVGEALAHGVPRLGGIDLSEHLGEDRLLPLTDLMTNKKKLEDEYTDMLKASAGSAAHVGYNMLLGARDLSNGDYLEGAAKFMPEMVRNVMEGAQLARYGYVDKAGFKYPGGDPSSGDVAAKMLGFTPSDEANYEEKAQTVEGVKARQEYDAQNIQTHLAKGFNRQDPAMYGRWLQANNQFMLSHPGLPPPVMGFAGYLREHMMSSAMAGAMGTPLGVSPRDFLTRGMVSYGNAGDR